MITLLSLKAILLENLSRQKVNSASHLGDKRYMCIRCLPRAMQINYMAKIDGPVILEIISKSINNFFEKFVHHLPPRFGMPPCSHHQYLCFCLIFTGRYRDKCEGSVAECRN